MDATELEVEIFYKERGLGAGDQGSGIRSDRREVQEHGELRLRNFATLCRQGSNTCIQLLIPDPRPLTPLDGTVLWTQDSR